MRDDAKPEASLYDLVDCDSQAEFVKRATLAISSDSKKPSLAMLARRCGFSSKSFLREVIIGKKKLSPSSARKFAKGLNLPETVDDYLQALIDRDLAKSETARAKADRALGKIRNRVLSSRVLDTPRTPDADGFAQNWRLVYAALGSEETGARIEDIESRAKLPRAEAASVLKLLMEYGLVRYNEGTRSYHAHNHHLILTRLPKDHQGFPQYFAHSLRKLKEVSETDFSSKSNLLFASAFTIREKDLPRVREQLHDTLCKLVDELEYGSGDQVKTLLLGFF